MKKQWYVARVDYQTTAGNPVTAEIKVRAINEDKALGAAIEKVMRWKRCMKVVGGNCVPFNSPAPTDWAKQGDILFGLREKAITYIQGCTETALFVYSGLDIVYARADGKRMITVNWDGEDSNEAEMEAVEDLDISTLVMVCTAIEKALAVGGQKP
jgi:hypothetical protein